MPIELKCKCCPNLGLDANLAAIKRATKRAPVETVKVSSRAFTHFATKLEGNWGRLNPRIPAFFDDYVRGDWSGRPRQRVPTSLLGDFGEFFGWACFRRAHAVVGRTARVIRPAGLPRPDFIIEDAKTKEVYALECKATSRNARYIQAKVRNAGANYPLVTCASLRDKRREGVQQVANSDVQLIAGRVKVPFAEANTIANYGTSTIFANAAVVAVTAFTDGRMCSGALFPKSRLDVPPRCSASCVDCLRNGNKSVVLTALFEKNERLVRQMQLPGLELPEFFAQYARLGRAVWLGSGEMFDAAWKDLREPMLEAVARPEAEGRFAAMLMVLDLLAGASERHLPFDPADQMEWLKESLSSRNLGPALEKVAAFQLNEVVAPVVEGEPTSSVVMGLPEEGEEEADIGEEPRRPHRRNNASDLWKRLEEYKDPLARWSRYWMPLESSDRSPEVHVDVLSPALPQAVLRQPGVLHLWLQDKRVGLRLESGGADRYRLVGESRADLTRAVAGLAIMVGEHTHDGALRKIEGLAGRIEERLRQNQRAIVFEEENPIVVSWGGEVRAGGIAIEFTFDDDGFGFVEMLPRQDGKTDVIVC